MRSVSALRRELSAFVWDCGITLTCCVVLSVFIPVCAVLEAAGRSKGRKG